jgi:PAS domain S-box-containing protein
MSRSASAALARPNVQRWAWTLAILLGGLGLSVWLLLSLSAERKRREAADFVRLTRVVEEDVVARLGVYEDALRAGVAFLRASSDASRAEWREFAASLDLIGHYPGVRGLGVVHHVPPGDVEAYVRRQRAGGAPDFDVHVVAGAVSDPQTDRYVVTYLEPEERNRAAVGLDLGSEAFRREALEASCDSGEPRLTRPIALVQDGKARPAFLYFFPVYRPGFSLDTPAARQAALSAWVVAPFVLEEFVSQVHSSRAGKVELWVFAGSTTRSEDLLYQSVGGAVPAAFERVGTLHLAGRSFTFAWNRGPRFFAAPLSPLIGIAAAILGVSCIVAGMFWWVQGSRLRADAAHAASEERFRTAFEYTGIGMAITGLDKRWIEVNQTLAQLLGYARNELVGRSFQEFTPPEDLPPTLSGMENLLAGQLSHYTVEKRYIRRDGRTVYARVTVALVRNPDGTPRYYVTQMEDITARHEAERALLESQRRLTDVFRAMAEGLVLHDAEGHIIECNAAAESILGLSRMQLLGLTPYDVRWQALDESGTPCSGDNHPSSITRTTGQPQRGVVMGVRRGDERLIWVSVNTEPILDDHGRVRAVVTSFTDITERKALLDSLAQARDEALQASRLKSAFVANMSHEIRTPMNGVLGMADLLMESPLSEEQHQMARVIQTSARNLLTIIDDILDLSKIEAGKLTIELSDFDLGDQVDQALALLSPRAQARGLVLDSDLPAAPLPRVRGDGVRLQQVLVNLLGNAIKFTERGGITLKVRALEPPVTGHFAFRVEVQDTGIGIPPEQVSRLFQPFSQADESTTRKYGGTGLGLAISRQLVELMGGRIGVESAPGRGSLFWFELKLPLAGARLAGVERGTVAGSPGTRPRILVAEDNEANQLVIRLMLERLGLEYDLVGDGIAALHQLGEGNYGAMLLDCQMPGMDGYEVTRRVREGAAGSRHVGIPILALTANAMASDRERCLRAGMSEFLSKPIRFERLQKALHQLGIPTIGGGPVQPVAPAPSGGPVLDAAHLAELRSLPGETAGTTLLDALVTRALHELPPDFARLQVLATAGAGPEFAALAHRLAGSVASLGATVLRSRLAEAEQAAQRGDHDAVRGFTADLDQQWRLLQDALRSLLPSASR